MKKLSSAILIFIYVINLSAQDREVNSMNTLRNELNSLLRINEELREEVNRLKYALIEKEESSKAISKTENKGEEYRIQLGVQGKSIQTLASPKMLIGSIINDKMVYDIAGFQNANDAFFLSQELRKLNLAGSFVTRYINGVRDYSYRFDPYQTSTNYTPPQANYSAPQTNYTPPKTNYTPPKTNYTPTQTNFTLPQTKQVYYPPQPSYYPHAAKTRPSNVSEPEPEIEEFKKNPTVTKSKVMVIED